MKNMSLILGDTAYIVCPNESDQDVLVRINTVDLPRVSAVSGKWLVRKTNPKANTSYALTTVTTGAIKRTVYMHRLIVGDPEGAVTDHLDRDGINNVRENLDVVTQKENMRRAVERKKEREAKHRCKKRNSKRKS